jgi:hypothetical protein
MISFQLQVTSRNLALLVGEGGAPKMCVCVRVCVQGVVGWDGTSFLKANWR